MLLIGYIKLANSTKVHACRTSSACYQRRSDSCVPLLTWHIVINIIRCPVVHLIGCIKLASSAKACDCRTSSVPLEYMRTTCTEACTFGAFHCSGITYPDSSQNVKRFSKFFCTVLATIHPLNKLHHLVVRRMGFQMVSFMASSNKVELETHS